MKDLRSFLERVDSMGELKVVPGAHWDLEIGEMTQLLSQREPSPAVVFDEIQGYPKGFRIAVNTLGSLSRLGMVLGVKSQDSRMEFIREWRQRYKNFKYIPPVVVKDGPVLENVLEGDDVDMFMFPSPKWHKLDGGRYIGTAGATITRDPDSDWVNVGTYRVMVHDKNTLGFFLVTGNHAWMQREKYRARGENYPVAISFGHLPHVFLGGCTESPYGLCEYDFIGGLLGEPLEVIKGEYTGLPIPAHSEGAIEGEAILDTTLPEGPFGEFPGYYASGERPEPIIRVKRLMFRNNPIILGSPPAFPPADCTQSTLLMRSAMIWEELERAGIPGVTGVWSHPAAPRFIIVVAIKQHYPGHARQVGMSLISSYPAYSNNGRYVIIVDDDIDPSDTTGVLWALGTRTNPETSIEVIRGLRSTAIDPMIRKGEPPIFPRAIIDATRPWTWKDEFPPSIAFTPQERDEAMRKWGAMLFG